jgi:hypothetical protein
MSDCDSLEIGSFYFLTVNAWPTGMSSGGLYQKAEGRHGQVSLFGFQDIPGNLDLYMTDRAWDETSGSFVPNTIEEEGIVTYRTPPRGLPAGIPFGMGNNTVLGDSGFGWTDVDVNRTGTDTSQYFVLGEDGDQIFFYCVGSDGTDRPIAAFSYGGPFLRSTESAEPITEYGTSTSSAPSYFFEGAAGDSAAVANIPPPKTPGLLVMRTPGRDNRRIFWNWEFQSPCGDNCVMDFFVLRSAIANADQHWIGSNPDGSFSYPSAASALLSAQKQGVLSSITFLLSWLVLWAV